MGRPSLGSAGPTGRSAPRRDGFSAAAWQRAADERTRRAFQEVPFYRDQWAREGRATDEARPTPSDTLPAVMSTLYPFGRPVDLTAEPPPWTGVPQDLLAAVRLGTSAHVPAVLEVRTSWVDWTRLGMRGPRYAAVLSGAATGVDPARLHTLDGAARALLSRSDDPVVVGSAAELAEVCLRLGVAGRAVLRTGLAGAADSGNPTAPAVVADPYLGYFAAGVPSCGAWHVSWRRFHAAVRDGAIVVTALRRRRPSLICVAPEPSAFTAIGRCAVHGTPVLLR